MKRLNALSFKQLRALNSVTTSHSISRAADDLALTPPAVHAQLKSLEENFGCTLLTRDGPQPFTATPEGEALLLAFQKCLAALDLAVREIDALGKGLRGSVVLGVVSTGKYFAPRLVAAIKATCPDIAVKLWIGNRDELIAALSEGAVDLAIMGRPPRDPPITAYPIGDHPHVLIVPPDHRLVGLENVTADDILSETFISREQGSGTRILATRILDRLGEGRTYETLEMGSNETIKQAVIAGLGIALISMHTVTDELRSGRLKTISAPMLPVIRKWYLLHRQDLRMTGAMRTVVDFIESQKGAFLPRV